MKKSCLLSLLLSFVIGCASIDKEARSIRLENLEAYARKTEKELEREILLPENIPQAVNSYHILKAKNLLSVKLVKTWQNRFLFTEINYLDSNKDGEYDKRKIGCFYGEKIPHVSEIRARQEYNYPK